MIGFSVGDIIKLLDQIPLWKMVSALPKRVKELEERVAALEGKNIKPHAPACPICGEAMQTTAVRPNRKLGFAGVQRHTLTCACGHSEERLVDPHKRI